MAKFLQYTGPADSREVGSADYKKAGVDGRKTIFTRGVPARVESDETADALLSHPLFEGEFVEVDEPAGDEVEAEQEPMTEKTLVGNQAASGGADEDGAST